MMLAKLIINGRFSKVKYDRLAEGLNLKWPSVVRWLVSGGGWKSFTQLSERIDAGELFGEHSAALGSTLPADSRRAASNGSREVPETWVTRPQI